MIMFSNPDQNSYDELILKNIRPPSDFTKPILALIITSQPDSWTCAFNTEPNPEEWNAQHKDILLQPCLCSNCYTTPEVQSPWKVRPKSNNKLLKWCCHSHSSVPIPCPTQRHFITTLSICDWTLLLRFSHPNKWGSKVPINWQKWFYPQPLWPKKISPLPNGGNLRLRLNQCNGLEEGLGEGNREWPLHKLNTSIWTRPPFFFSFFRVKQPK